MAKTIDNDGLICCDEELIKTVIGAADRVLGELGPGLLESVYEAALAMELVDAGLSAKRQVQIPALYRGRDLGLGFRADLIVEDCLLLELKTVDELSKLNVAQILTYLKLLGFRRGYLLNFNSRNLSEGKRRVTYYPRKPEEKMNDS